MKWDVCVLRLQSAEKGVVWTCYAALFYMGMYGYGG